MWISVSISTSMNMCHACHACEHMLWGHVRFDKFVALIISESILAIECFDTALQRFALRDDVEQITEHSSQLLLESYLFTPFLHALRNHTLAASSW